MAAVTGMPPTPSTITSSLLPTLQRARFIKPKLCCKFCSSLIMALPCLWLSSCQMGKCLFFHQYLFFCRDVNKLEIKIRIAIWKSYKILTRQKNRRKKRELKMFLYVTKKTWKRMHEGGTTFLTAGVWKFRQTIFGVLLKDIWWIRSQSCLL